MPTCSCRDAPARFRCSKHNLTSSLYNATVAVDLLLINWAWNIPCHQRHFWLWPLRRSTAGLHGHCTEAPRPLGALQDNTLPTRCSPAAGARPRPSHLSLAVPTGSSAASSPASFAHACTPQQLPHQPARDRHTLGCMRFTQLLPPAPARHRHDNPLSAVATAPNKHGKHASSHTRSGRPGRRSRVGLALELKHVRARRSPPAAAAALTARPSRSTSQS